MPSIVMIYPVLAYFLGVAICLVQGQSANSDGDLRLVTNSGLTGGSSGRLEVYYNSQWGTVCEDFFSEVDAQVACRQLGYSDVVRHDIIGNLGFLQPSSSTPIWLDDVGCSGTESRLIDCSHLGFGNENCVHREDVGLICSAPTNPRTNVAAQDDLRLVGTNVLTGGMAGRVEIYYNGQWGTVCESSVAKTEADVVCRQLGFTEAVYYGTVDELSYLSASSSTPTVLQNIDCSGFETRLGFCSHNGYLSASCSHSNDLAVICNGTSDSSSSQSFLPTGSLRLNTQGDSSPRTFSGRLEVYANGEWGTVCDDGFGRTEADTACRQLGFLSALYYGTVGTIGFSQASSGVTIQLDGFGCSSDLNDALINCTHGGLGVHNCNHGEDVALVCLGVGSLRLTSSSGSTSLSQSSGRLEVYVNGLWGTVCDDLFGQSDADVACRQLGYSRATGFDDVDSSYSASSSFPIWLDDLICSSSDNFLLRCGHRGIGVENCGHSEDVELTCAFSDNSSSNITGIAVGVPVGLILIIIFVFAVYYHGKKKKQRQRSNVNSTPRAVYTAPRASAAAVVTTTTTTTSNARAPVPVQTPVAPTHPSAPQQPPATYASQSGQFQPYPTQPGASAPYPTGSNLPPAAPYPTGQAGYPQKENPELYPDAPPSYNDLSAYPPATYPQTDPSAPYPPQGPQYY